MTRRLTDDEIDALTDRVSEALDVPEPSPLFWEHFPERVRAAVAAEAPAPAPRAWWRRPAQAAAIAALVISVGAAGMVLRGWRVAPETPPAAALATAPATGVDGAWSVVAASAAEAGLDGLHEAGFAPAPGDADVAFEDLTQGERAALVALLEAELRGGGDGGS